MSVDLAVQVRVPALPYHYIRRSYPTDEPSAPLHLTSSSELPVDDPPARRYPTRDRHPPNRLNLATQLLDLSALPATAYGVPEPSSYREATLIPEWQSTMTDELSALEHTSIWDLVPLPSGAVPITCKWVFKVKTRMAQWRDTRHG